MQNVEAKVRILSEQSRNGYFIAIFACCRDFFNAGLHCGCVGAKSSEEAKLEFQSRMYDPKQGTTE